MQRSDDPSCATCRTYVCRLGYRDLGPPNCPMRGNFPTLQELYKNREDLLAVGREATIVEAQGYRRWTRGQEIIELARRMGIRKVGLAACSGMDIEVDIYARWLDAAGFDVLRGRDAAEGDRCAPRAQASYLNQAGSELTVLMGTCVGHDALFMRASRALVTTFIARDTLLRHNPAAALYTQRSYFNRPLYRAHRQVSAAREVEPRTLQDAARDPFGHAATLLEEIADQVVHDGVGRWCRVEELLEFAGRAGARTLGLIFCAGLREEARLLYRVLQVNNFRVLSVQCKTGAVPKEEMGILDSQKVRPGTREMMCNPLAQAKILNDAQTDLNILLGQCAGHDTGSIATSSALTIPLVVKDRVLAHNTAAELYRRALWGEASA